MYTVVSTSEKRAQFVRVQKAVSEFSRGINPDQFIIQPSDIVLIKELVNNQERYVFDLYPSAGNELEGEYRLNRNNLFYMGSIALCLQRRLDDGSQNGPLYTHPDTNVFTGVSGGVNERDCLETVYQGIMNFNTEPVKRITDLQTFNFRYTPTDVTTEATFVGISNATRGVYGPSDSERGFYALNYLLGIDGQNNNKVELILGAGDKTVIAGDVDASGDANDQTNHLVLILKGWEIQNAAQQANRWQI